MAKEDPKAESMGIPMHPSLEKSLRRMILRSAEVVADRVHGSLQVERVTLKLSL